MYQIHILYICPLKGGGAGHLKGVVAVWIADLMLIAIVWLFAPEEIALMATAAYFAALWMMYEDIRNEE